MSRDRAPLTLVIKFPNGTQTTDAAWSQERRPKNPPTRCRSRSQNDRRTRAEITTASTLVAQPQRPPRPRSPRSASAATVAAYGPYEEWCRLAA